MSLAGLTSKRTVQNRELNWNVRFSKRPMCLLFWDTRAVDGRLIDVENRFSKRRFNLQNNS